MGLLAYLIEHPKSQGRHPAADSVLRADYCTSIAGENPYTGGTFFCEQQTLGAAQEEPEAGSVFAFSRGDFRQDPPQGTSGKVRQRSFQVAHPRRQRPVDSRRINQLAEADLLEKTQWSG